MRVTQRRELSPEDAQELADARAAKDQADADYKRVVVKMLLRSSYGTMHELTDLSKTTLGNWKRELSED